MGEEGFIHIRDRDIGNGWNPVQGPALTRLLESNTSLSEDEKSRLVSETVSIMRQCADPKSAGDHNTGLIIGYVQSGKTLSFTSLSALAHDNDYQIVLLLAGTTNNLVEQSFDRLKKDLEVEKNRNWKLFSTRDKGFQSAEVERVKSELAKWKKGSPRSRTVLIVSMKEHRHLKHLATLLSGTDLSNVPTLIIDDEGDQAGMNTKALQQEESTTYSRITELRRIFPHHSYLLYTATPQAPLLISKIDTLSPDFGAVLTPGAAYVGGKEFFVENSDNHIELIPQTDVPDRDEPPASPPKSLLDALRYFFLGVAIGLLEEDDQDGNNRSMMIHPAVPKADHLMFKRWAQNTRDEWALILENNNHPSHSVLISEFQSVFEGITKTYPVDFGFDEIEPLLFDAVSETVIAELNTREKNKIPTIDWKGDYSWILVGGIGLDRGFTVEGLTVSYMPRSIGIGNADNIQQRARFFGYKKAYLGLCRIYLTAENIEAFEDFVTHEESLRQSIAHHIEKGGDLKDWRRTWYLSERLQPTRRSVVLLDMFQSKGRKGWIYPDFPYEGTDLVADNREVVNSLLDEFPLWEYKEEGWNDRQTIPAFSDQIRLDDIIPFVGQIRYQNPNDSLQHSSIMIGLERLISEYPDMRCHFYAFSGPWSGSDVRRSLNDKNPPKIRQLFQGSNARTKYPGASKIHSDEVVSFHVHRYHLENHEKTRILLEDLPVLAVHFPEHLAERVWLERTDDAF
ncbi:Z1 domain-containing protein [Ruegeria atlantica]|uniref:Z1 domain-containing protein n=1 Tax=Ruegeria atlantica TaxID=81569 RepID=UPI00147C813C|nr:Z1 domain-containing protein [Ruegeria atlantica]